MMAPSTRWAPPLACAALLLIVLASFSAAQGDPAPLENGYQFEFQRVGTWQGKSYRIKFELDSCNYIINIDVAIQGVFNFQRTFTNSSSYCRVEPSVPMCSMCVALRDLHLSPVSASFVPRLYQECDLGPFGRKQIDLVRFDAVSLGKECSHSSCEDCTSNGCGWCPLSGRCMAHLRAQPYCQEKCGDGLTVEFAKCPVKQSAEKQAHSSSMSPAAKAGVVVAAVVVGGVVLYVVIALIVRRRRQRIDRYSERTRIFADSANSSTWVPMVEPDDITRPGASRQAL